MNEVSDDRPELVQKLSELEILRQSLEAAKPRGDNLLDKLLRLKADLTHFRKRSETQQSEARRAGREDILTPVIILSDAFVQAENATKQATDINSLKQGLAMVQQQFEKFLKDQGLVPIKSVGEKFDPHQHEAIVQEVNEDLEEGTILNEIQRGYALKGRVIRPARVSVSTKPKDGASNESPQEDNHV